MLCGGYCITAVDRSATGEHFYRIKLAVLARALGQQHMAVVHGIEHPAHDANTRRAPFHRACRLRAHMPISEHNIFLRGKTFQPHRTARMNLVGGNTDFGAETVFETISKTSRGINHHRAGIHFTQEAPPAVDAPAPVNASPPAQRGAAELVEAPPEAGAPRPAGQADLWGDLLGEATEAMARLDNARMGNDRLVISCAKLVRVDFPAAGDILQWVGQRHAEGCQLQFRDLHRLIAAFFHLIGIDEQSSVLARSD